MEYQYVMYVPTFENIQFSDPSTGASQADDVFSQNPQDVISLSTLAKDPEYCNTMVDKLDSALTAEKHTLLEQLSAGSRQLALSRSGCRVIQKAFEVAGGPHRDLMISELREHVTELYESPHGNHVLSKAIEVLPASKTAFIVSAFRGRAIAVSKHRFGCRVMCRLIEHCGEEHIGELLDEVLAEASALSQHAFGNFVVQTALEHTAHARRSAIVSQVLPHFGLLCTHRTGSLVAQRILSYCDEVHQNLAIHALLKGNSGTSILEVATSHYGSYVLEQIASMCTGTQVYLVEEVAHVLRGNLQFLTSSQHALRVIDAFGFVLAEPIAASA